MDIYMNPIAKGPEPPPTLPASKTLKIFLLVRID